MANKTHRLRELAGTTDPLNVPIVVARKDGKLHSFATETQAEKELAGVELEFRDGQFFEKGVDVALVDAPAPVTPPGTQPGSQSPPRGRDTI